MDGSCRPIDLFLLPPVNKGWFSKGMVVVFASNQWVRRSELALANCSAILKVLTDAEIILTDLLHIAEQELLDLLIDHYNHCRNT